MQGLQYVLRFSSQQSIQSDSVFLVAATISTIPTRPKGCRRPYRFPTYAHRCVEGAKCARVALTRLFVQLVIFIPIIAVQYYIIRATPSFIFQSISLNKNGFFSFAVQVLMSHLGGPRSGTLGLLRTWSLYSFQRRVRDSLTFSSLLFAP